MEILGLSTTIINLMETIDVGPPPGAAIPNPLVDSVDVLCQPMLTGTSTGTSIAIGGSANNCLDV